MENSAEHAVILLAEEQGESRAERGKTNNTRRWETRSFDSATEKKTQLKLAAHDWLPLLGPVPKQVVG